jgi:hypothetical protein
MDLNYELSESEVIANLEFFSLNDVPSEALLKGHTPIEVLFPFYALHSTCYGRLTSHDLYSEVISAMCNHTNFNVFPLDDFAGRAVPDNLGEYFYRLKEYQMLSALMLTIGIYDGSFPFLRGSGAFGLLLTDMAETSMLTQKAMIREYFASMLAVPGRGLDYTPTEHFTKRVNTLKNLAELTNRRTSGATSTAVVRRELLRLQF